MCLHVLEALTIAPEALGNPAQGPVKPALPARLGQKPSKETDEEVQLRLEVEATTRLAAAFLEHIGTWEAMVEALARVDVLLAFAGFAAEAGE